MYALPLLLLLLLAARALGQNLTSSQLDAVKADLWAGAQQTWELGTEAEALLESDAPAFAVYANASLPPPQSALNATAATGALAPVFQIAANVIAARNTSVGPQPFLNVTGGAAGDPASIGVAVLLANWSGAPLPPSSFNGSGGGQSGAAPSYARAAAEQLEFTLTVVPRTSDGAISHRIEQVQLWADSVSMVPPFLAYYAVLTGNQSLLTEAYTQASPALSPIRSHACSCACID